ncbi:MAG: Nramp family divalent metal transporter [Acidobacteria bacterium]|nr:Nramp family divalent metal transporter [Acidobacteriota bacterium]
MIPTTPYPPLPPDLSESWPRLIRIFGPGAVVASVTVGTGETIFSPRLGALFGYEMLWVILIAVIFKSVLVYTGGRHLVLTGEHPMEAWARLPGPRGWFPALIGGVAVVSFPLWVAALTDAVSSLCVWMSGWGRDFPSGRPLWSTTIILAAMLLSVVQTYNIVERVSTAFLALKILFIFAAIIVVRPDWGAALAGMVTPKLPAYEPWVAARYPDVASSTALFHAAVFLGVIGGGVQDYLGYVGLMREKKWGWRGASATGQLPLDASSVKRGLAWARAPLFDLLASFTCVLILTVCFMLLGAAVLHPRMEVPTSADLYSKQSQFLALVHPSLVSVYKAGIFFAMFGAIYGTFEIYSRTAYESLRAVWPQRTWPFSGVRLWITLYAGGGALLLLWTGLQTVTLVKITSPPTGVLGCGLWCLAMLWVDRAQMPPPYRMNRPVFALTVAAGLMMSAIGLYTTYKSWS